MGDDNIVWRKGSEEKYAGAGRRWRWHWLKGCLRDASAILWNVMLIGCIALVYLSIHPSIHLSIYPSIHLSI